MPSLPEFFAAALATLDSGGAVMPWILLLSVVMWSLIIERYLEIRRMQRETSISAESTARRETPRNPRVARRLRAAIAADLRYRARRDLALIRAIVQTLPLLGLLGTVMGLVQTFDVITFFGASHRQAISAGISTALIATLGGLVTALSGLYCATHLEACAQRISVPAAPLHPAEGD